MTTLPLGADILIKVTGLQDTSGTYINSAVVTAAILSDGEKPLSPPITVSLSYVTSSNGNYQGVLAATATTALVQYTRYILRATATVGGTLAWTDQQICDADYLET